MARVCFSIKA